MVQAHDGSTAADLTGAASLAAPLLFVISQPPEALRQTDGLALA